MGTGVEASAGGKRGLGLRSAASGFSPPEHRRKAICSKEAAAVEVRSSSLGTGGGC